MTQIVGVRFKKVGKIYFFDSDKINLEIGDNVIAETTRGIEFGEVVEKVKKSDAEAVGKPIKKIIRIATKEDKRKLEKNKNKERTAFNVCLKKIAKHKLKMKLINAEYTFDNKKLLFYFTSDERVDFRSLVKDLASVFKTRIELRQVGVRDQSKFMGGLGICGKPFCCSTFLSNFQPVSIKMAKEQGLSLNPTKISGTCGRLMCCLQYEQASYEYLLNNTPKIGAIVSTISGKGTVIDQNILTGKITVRMDKTPEAAPMIFNAKDVKIIKDGKITLKKDEIEKLKQLEE